MKEFILFSQIRYIIDDKLEVTNNIYVSYSWQETNEHSVNGWLMSTSDRITFLLFCCTHTNLVFIVPMMVWDSDNLQYLILLLLDLKLRCICIIICCCTNIFYMYYYYDQ